ncbi:MAG: serine O-acetyltransferase EpsC [Haloarculaceae archaeon]
MKYDGNAHQALLESYREDEDPFPTGRSMDFPRRDHRWEEVAVIKRLLFPRCWNADSLLRDESAVLDQFDELAGLFGSGIRPYSGEDPSETVHAVLDRFPDVRETLKKDVEAAYKGDPAARTYLEIIRSYPGFHAIAIQRIAHALYEAGAAEYARELTESANTVTGIDIHPGAEVGDYFFVDHGTGVVIGETTTVGDWVRIYQDVTLGALHFEEAEDEERMLKKGYKRHPDIGDHVVIGAGTKVLGPVSIGNHVSIGANSWVTESIPDHTSVFVSEHPDQERKSTD